MQRVEELKKIKQAAKRCGGAAIGLGLGAMVGPYSGLGALFIEEKKFIAELGKRKFVTACLFPNNVGLAPLCSFYPPLIATALGFGLPAGAKIGMQLGYELAKTESPYRIAKSVVKDAFTYNKKSGLIDDHFSNTKRKKFREMMREEKILINTNDSDEINIARTAKLLALIQYKDQLAINKKNLSEKKALRRLSLFSHLPDELLIKIAASQSSNNELINQLDPMEIAKNHFAFYGK